MTELLNDVETPSDAELIARVRGGEVAAYGLLFSRHRDAANRLARQLVRGPDSDDLVSEAFAKVLVVLQGGGGPDVAFRAYLLTAVRRLHVDRIRSGQRLHTTDDMTPFDPGVPFTDTAVAGFESGAAAKAFASLPERWQLVLWHLEVEGQKPADIAELLGMSPNSVSALAYRAREGLRQAFLTMHLSDIAETQCRWVNEHLGAFVRKGLAKRDATKVQSHLDECRQCTAMHLELTEVNGNLAGIIAPLLLGAAAAGYLASATGSVGAVGVLTLVGRVRDIAAIHTGAVAAGTVASGAVAAAVATVVVTHIGASPPDVTADPAVGLTSRAPATSPVTPGPRPSPSTRPTPSVSPSASPKASATPSPTPSVSPSMVPSLTPSPTVSLSPLLPLLPLEPTATPTPTDLPTATDTPTPTDPATPGDATPTADDPTVAPDGTVTVTVHQARSTDVVGVQVVSDSGDTTFVTSGLPDPCTSMAPDAVSCTPMAQTPPEDGSAAPPPDADWIIRLPLAYPDDMVEDDVHVVVTINSDTVATGTSASFHPSRTPRFDFSLGSATQTAHTLSGEQGDVDSYTLRTTAHLPRRLAGLRYTLSGDTARFGTAGDGCEVGEDGATYTCPDVRNGDDVDLPVTATGLSATTDATLTVAPLVAFDDPDTSDDATTVQLRPGTHLGLTPHDLGQLHQDATGAYDVSTTVSGVRNGLGQVSLGLSPGLTVGDVRTAGCRAEAGSVLCEGLSDGSPVSFTVTSDHPARAADLIVTATPGGDFLDLANDNTATAALVPAYDFTLGELALRDHTVSGGTDRYTLRTSVPALPGDLDAVDLEVTDGGTFAADQPSPGVTGCERTDPTHVHCTGLAAGGTVDLAVDSTDTARHAVSVRLVRPPGYDDPDPTNDTATLTGLSPAVDLHLGPLTPSAPLPQDDGSFAVSTTLGGVRGPVTLTVSGATVTGSSCPHSDAHTVTCASPDEGQRVDLTLVSAQPRGADAVTVTASSGSSYTELDPSDNTATTTLAPDVAITSVVVTGHRGVDNSVAVVRAQITGIPAGVSTVRVRLSGAAVGLRANQLHLTNRAAGSDGQGGVNCYVSNAYGTPSYDGLYATCTGVRSAVGGRFWVDMGIRHPHGTPTALTFTVLPVAVDEGSHSTANNSRDLTLT